MKWTRKLLAMRIRLMRLRNRCRVWVRIYTILRKNKHIYKNISAESNLTPSELFNREFSIFAYIFVNIQLMI